MEIKQWLLPVSVFRTYLQQIYFGFKMIPSMNFQWHLCTQVQSCFLSLASDRIQRFSQKKQQFSVALPTP